MSRTYRKEKDNGDYWSRRCFGCHCMAYGKVSKKITKKKERQRNRTMIKNIVKNTEDFEKRFRGE